MASSSEEVYWVQTSSTQLAETFVMSVARRDVFHFSLQSCNIAFVGLFAQSLQGYAFEVLFGYPDKHSVSLYDTKTRNFLESATYENLVRF